MTSLSSTSLGFDIGDADAEKNIVDDDIWVIFAAFSVENSVFNLVSFEGNQLKIFFEGINEGLDENAKIWFEEFDRRKFLICKLID